MPQRVAKVARTARGPRHGRARAANHGHYGGKVATRGKRKTDDGDDK